MSAEAHGLRYGAQVAPGTENVGPDALSRFRRRSSQKLDGEVFVPGDSGEEMPKKKPAGPVLDGVPLQHLAPPLESLQQVDKEHPQLGALVYVPVELRPLVKHREELTLDGIRLADFGAAEVDNSEEIHLAVFYAVQLTPEPLEVVATGCGSSAGREHVADHVAWSAQLVEASWKSKKADGSFR